MITSDNTTQEKVKFTHSITVRMGILAAGGIILLSSVLFFLTGEALNQLGHTFKTKVDNVLSSEIETETRKNLQSYGENLADYVTSIAAKAGSALNENADQLSDAVGRFRTEREETSLPPQSDELPETPTLPIQA